ncbi:Glutathione transport system permease protein GsiD [Halobacillus karajensis]|uniref:Glutathione transport system permease protein GsiD n=2 Tax=Halobacillus karajensis TaxID=195088 RepID=A0A024P2X6_9BACI|nr:Glutathione transport system permease protein GsiD [Halobacillus karajensis]CDQ22863.1 Glutathione transport system permease protein GsiD [Halobacillus karajensis]CDQ26345.1 Glutathione transport system permease protein GsiD [Halobacillus karajensis]
MADSNTLTSEQVYANKKESKKEKMIVKTAKRLLKNKLAVFGLIIIIIQVILAVFVPLFATYDPIKQDLTNAELGIGSDGHWLGTDNYGRDVWSRIVFGARISLLVGIGSVGLGLLGGIALGLVSGYFKKLDGIIMRFVDLLFAFPGILLAMLIIAMLGTSLVNVVIAISIWSIPTCARIVRGSVLSIKKQEYILAMKSLGASNFRILVKHVLPNCTAPIIVFATMRMATAILSTAALSFLGLGAQPPTAEWGAMIAAGQDFIFTSPHLTIVPGIAIMLVVFAFNVVGDGLRDALDPIMDLDQ